MSYLSFVPNGLEVWLFADK